MNRIDIPDSLRELLDSYRTESDLQLPEMQPLLVWIKESPRHREALAEALQWDDRVSQALQAVAVPAGLADRVRKVLLDSDLSRASPASGHVDEIDWSEPAGAIRPTNATYSGRRGYGKTRTTSHSIWLTWGAGLTAVAAVVLAIMVRVWMQPTHPTSPPAYELCRASLGWIQLAENSPWPADSDPNALDRDFIPKQVFRKQMRTDFGTTECYLTKLGSGRRVYQFSFRSDQSLGLPTEAPGLPDLPLNGFSCAAYQQGDQVFVVAVEGDAGHYRQAIQSGLPISGVDFSSSVSQSWMCLNAGR